MTIADRRAVPLIIVFGFGSMILTSFITDMTASRLLRVDTYNRAMIRLDTAMQVAWRIIHERGPNIRLVDGQLFAGDAPLEGNPALIDDASRLTGCEVRILNGNEGVVSAITAPDGGRALGPAGAWSRPGAEQPVGRSKAFRGRTNLGGQPYYAAYDPMLDERGHLVGTLFVGIPEAQYTEQSAHSRHIILASSLIGLVLSGAMSVCVACALGRQLHKRERSLEEANRRLDAALGAMAQGLCFFDKDSRLVVANRRFAEIYNLDFDAIPPGTSLDAIMELRRAARTLVVSGDKDYRDRLQRHLRANNPVTEMHDLADGRIITIHLQPMPEGGWVATHEDSTGRRQNEERITYLARHDALTGLPNRNFFMERMDQAAALTSRGESFAVHCLDLDHFKAVNDTLGHAVGDQLLQAVAQRLRTCLREGDTIARLGGDEFAIIQLHLRQPEEAALLARRVIETVGATYQLGDHMVQTSASVGISLAPGDGNDAASLLKQADMALYRSKADGRATFRFFEQEMDERLQKRRVLEIDLRLAVEHQQFELYFQPMVDVQSGQVTGFEALVRWQHPLRGMISPAEFIPLAEETGLISQIGAWVLQQACREAANWPGHLNVAVNVSPVQFKGDRLVDAVRQALAASGLAPERLELEITESLLLQNSAANLATLQQLHALGVTIAMDDFGTGYSSLSYLRSFPFDKIKIDQSFVRDLSEKEDCQAIIRAITGLGRSLGMRVLAEGVETSLQLDSLRQAGCQDVQGYYFSRPTPAHNVVALIKDLEARNAVVLEESA